jgi:hypothetical protein
VRGTNRAFQGTRWLVPALLLAIAGAACGSSAGESRDGSGGATSDLADGGGAGADGITPDAVGDAIVFTRDGDDEAWSSPDYSLSFPSANATVPAGSDRTATVLIARDGFMGTITLGAAGGPPGLAVTFTPAMIDGTMATINLAAAAAVAPATYAVTITGTSGFRTAQATLPVIVTTPATTLLVDHDDSDNNGGVATPLASPSDDLFEGYLAARSVIHNTFVVSSTDHAGPTAEAMKAYDTVVWYTGDRYGGLDNEETISSSDEAQLRAWLDTGGKRLLIFSNEYVYGLRAIAWGTGGADAFFTSYLGARGGIEAVAQNEKTTTVTGTSTPPAFVVKMNDPIKTYFDVVNPAAGTDTLFTISYDAAGTGAAAPTPVSTGRKRVGTARTSKVVWVGFSIENILVTHEANDLQRAALEALFAY